MDMENNAAPENCIRQAELILKLYELRREPLMREARSYVGGAFLPSSVDEFVAIVTAGDKNTGFVLQVYGYWEMVAAFVHHGALDAGLVYDTCGEMYFQYAKVRPYLAGFREKMDMPHMLANVERLIESTTEGRDRMLVMQKNLAAIAIARAAQAGNSH
jgi:hypothetical protein